MLYAFEILLTAYLLYSSYRIIKQGMARTVLGMGIVAVASAASVVAYLIMYLLVPLVFRNVVVQLVLLLGVPTVCFLTLSLWLSLKARRDDRPVVQKLKYLLRAPNWVSHLFCVTAAGLLCGVILVTLIILVSIAGVEPTCRQTIQSHSLFLHAFLPPPKTGRGAPNEPDLQETMSLQGRLLRRIGEGWNHTTNSVVEGTGMGSVLEQLEALKVVLNLSPAESAWLVEKNPGLKRMVEYPALRAVMENDHILNLMQQLSEGSPTALYTLGDEPAIRALFDDKEIMAVARSIDLLELRKQVTELRQNGGSPLKCHWASSSMNSTLELDRTLNDAALWQPCQEGVCLLTWKADTRLGLAKTGFDFAEAPKQKLTIRLQTEGQPTLFVNDEPVKLNKAGAARTCTVTFGTGTTRVVIMIDFSGVDGARTCAIDAFIPR